MLSELNIQNIAVIESADIAFGPGFNVLSGETGAGKSIIVDALSAVLGERTSRELIRTGADSARVSAVFTGLSAEIDDLLRDMDLEPTDGGELLVTRTIFAEGRNNCRIGGTPVTVAMLKRLEKRSGVSNIHPHRFRRTMATSLNQHGMPVEEVAMLLGHEEIKTTMKYVVKDKAMVKHHYQQIVA